MKIKMIIMAVIVALTVAVMPAMTCADNVLDGGK